MRGAKMGGVSFSFFFSHSILTCCRFALGFFFFTRRSFDPSLILVDGVVDVGLVLLAPVVLVGPAAVSIGYTRVEIGLAVRQCVTTLGLSRRRASDADRRMERRADFR